MYASPPSQPEVALSSLRGVSSMLQVSTGVAPEARSIFPDHAQLGLQQSQYLVVVPEPEADPETVALA